MAVAKKRMGSGVSAQIEGGAQGRALLSPFVVLIDIRLPKNMF